MCRPTALCHLLAHLWQSLREQAGGGTAQAAAAAAAAHNALTPAIVGLQTAQ